MRDNILQGRTRIGLICGGEALYSRKLEARAAGAGGGSMKVSGKESWMAGDLRDPLTALEQKYGLMLPVNVYPLFENALRFHEGLSIGEHLRELSEFCSAYSNIAMENPYAWFREKRSADEILNVSDQNRMVSWPYTKLMCSIIEVDQSAALFMTDEGTAVKLGVPVDKLVYTRGAGDASDIWHVTERVNLHASPSVKTAADKSMEEAEVSLNDIDYLDFYSCFPCAPRITRNMLDIDKGDPRPLTVTGGMPCFGGPGNN
jgi:acetyl-CoA C-acetyltransferase